MIRSYPRTIVLYVTTHGGIVVDEDEPELFSLPPEVEQFHRISAVQTGVCNFAESDHMNEVFEPIHHLVNAYDIDAHFSSITELSKAILKEYSKQTTVKTMTDQVSKEKKKRTKSDIELARAQAFIDRADSMFQVKKLKGGDMAVNKTFSVDFETFAKTIDRDSGSVDWAIHAVNMQGTPNLLLYLVKETGRLHISMKDVVDFLVKRGVANILLIDLSCSAVTDRDRNPVSDRLTRRLRRSNVGGRKKKRRTARMARRSRGKVGKL